MHVIPARSGPFQLRSLVGGIYLPALLFATGQGMVVPIIPLFAKELGAGVALAGVVVAMRGLGSMVGDVPSGLLVSRLGGRTMMAAGALLTAASAAAIGLSDGVPLLAAFVLVNGIAFALWHVSRLAFLTEVVPTEYRGRTLALVGGTSRVGLLVGPIAGGLLGQAAGLEAAFFAQAGVVGAAVLLVLVRMGGGRSSSRRG